MHATIKTILKRAVLPFLEAIFSSKTSQEEDSWSLMTRRRNLSQGRVFHSGIFKSELSYFMQSFTLPVHT